MSKTINMIDEPSATKKAWVPKPGTDGCWFDDEWILVEIDILYPSKK